MSDVSELRNTTHTGTLNLVLLTLATAGLFPLMWIYRHNKNIERITGAVIVTDVYLIWLAVCAGLSGSFANSDDALDPYTKLVLAVIAMVLSIASAVLYVVWAFKTKAALQAYAQREHNVTLKMNGFYTFLFTVYYINYCINDLPEAAMRQQPQAPSEHMDA